MFDYLIQNVNILDGSGRESFPGDVLMNAGYPLPVFHGDYQSLQLYLRAL